VKRHQLLRGIAKAARAKGVVWQLDRQGAGHEIWRCGRTSVPVPRHKEIADSVTKTLFRGARGRAREGLVAEMRQTFRAIAKRDGRWWFVHVPQEQGLYTQVRRLDQAEAMIREVIGLMRDMPEDSFDVVVEPQMDSLGDLQDTIEEALRARKTAEEAQEASSTAMRHAVREVRSSGYSARDAGMLLGVSNQRISQLERSEGRKRPPTP